jgi:hypothetical protein
MNRQPSQTSNFLVIIQPCARHPGWFNVTFLRISSNQILSTARHFEARVYVSNILDAQRAVFGGRGDLPTHEINYVGMHEEDQQEEDRAEVTNERVNLMNLSSNDHHYFVITLENNFFRGLR